MDMFVRGKNKPEPPTPLWSILAFFSFLPFVALPLTGLSMELKDGYHTTNQRPLVQGLRYENFNEVTGAGVGARSWSSGVAPALPQRGVIYTKEGVGRSTVDYLSKFPNMLPNNTKGITEAFLTPQSMLPMSGRSFGLLVSYDCTPIYKLSDFTILNKRRPNQEMAPQSYSDENDSSYYITIRNSTNAPDDTLAANFGAVLEEGISLWNGSDTVTDDPQGRVSNDCYFWDHNNANQYPGMDYVSVYEAILWQIVASTKPEDFDEVGLPRMDVKYNLTLAGNITELYGQYKNEYFDDDGNLEQTDYYSAIGARCTSSSAVGMADIDGPASTYSNFVRGDTPPADSATCMPRVDTAVPAGLMSLAMASDDFDTGDVSGDWIQNMFRSVNLAVPLTIPLTKSTLVNASNPEESLAGESFTIQLDYMQDVDFRDTLLRTFPAYVNEMMYNGGLSFSNSSGEQPIYFSHPNTTAFVAQKLFETGTINLWIPGAMLILWTVGTIVLAVMYGFRRRWAVELDGYSMFRFGADYAERVRERPEFGVNMPYEDCYLLKDIPGMIGDARPHMDTEPGKITLVQGGGEFLADKSKEYM
jgi:hypothetical protein